METKLDNAINELRDTFERFSKAILVFYERIAKIFREVRENNAKHSFNRFSAKKDIRNPEKGRPRRAYPP